VTSEAYRELGEAAWLWVLSQVREDEGPWLPAPVSEDGGQMAPAEDRDSLYAGVGGLAPVLAEIAQYRADHRLRPGQGAASRRLRRPARGRTPD
jgi:hypothetical protein